MRGLVFSLAASLLNGLVNAAPTERATGPFLTAVDNQTWIIGNEVWNMTQGPIYGVKLWYKERDCVGEAVGHYVSYSENLAVNSGSGIRKAVTDNILQMERQITWPGSLPVS